MKPSRAHARGFTLIELLIAAAVTVFVVASASLALINQYKGMQSADLTRQANGENRTALLQIEHSVRLLGWGIDPPYALDLYVNCPNVSTSQYCGRDSTTGADQLAFVARNPLYRYDYGPDNSSGAQNGCTRTGGCLSGNAYWVTSYTAGSNPSFTFASDHAVDFKMGQMFEVTCAKGEDPVLLTLGAAVKTTGAGNVTLNNFTGDADASGTVYNDTGALQACHGYTTGDTAAAIFQVDRYRYLVQTINGVSWLLLDNGLDNNGDNVIDSNDYLPVAKNVEDMQVAYVYNSDSSYTPVDGSTGNWVLGDNAADLYTEPPRTGTTAPDYTDLTSSANRYDANPANVRAVRVTLLFRGDRRDPIHNSSWTNLTTGTAMTIEDRNLTLTGDGYRRFTAQTEVYTRNLESRLPFIF